MRSVEFGPPTSITACSSICLVAVLESYKCRLLSSPCPGWCHWPFEVYHTWICQISSRIQVVQSSRPLYGHRSIHAREN